MTDETAAQTPPPEKIGFLGGKKAAIRLQDELSNSMRREEAAERIIDELRGQLKEMGALDILELEKRRSQAMGDLDALAEQMEARRAAELAKTEELLVPKRSELKSLEHEMFVLRNQIVASEEEADLQEAGVYQFRHPLESVVGYEKVLEDLKARIKAYNKSGGGAITATTDWTVNGSATEGRKMVNQTSKLMLRAFNAEADYLVKTLKPYKLEQAMSRLRKVAATIEKLGQTMKISITGPYLATRLSELEWTADYREKQAVEKEKEREKKSRLREEKMVQQEIEKERARLEKERQHFENALAVVEGSGDQEAINRVRAQLEDVQRAVDEVDYRAANIRAGYVYVISNVGSFGDGMVKVGMTRRLDPMDRIRELSDASVPFNFDIHALFFSEDAVGIEAAMHTELSAVRVNAVNQRREFFYANPGETKRLLLGLTGELLTFDEFPEAAEYQQSRHRRPQAAELPEVHSIVAPVE